MRNVSEREREREEGREREREREREMDQADCCPEDAKFTLSFKFVCNNSYSFFGT